MGLSPSTSVYSQGLTQSMSSLLQDPKMQQRIAQSKNAVPVEDQANAQGMPDPVASNATLEKDDPQVAQALRKITSIMARQIIIARRMQIYRTGRSELYFLGKQKIFWSGQREEWMGTTPNGGIISAESYEAESFDYVTNFYRAYCESFMTTASQNVPGVPFHPEDQMQREDVEAAKAATSASELIARFNDAPMLLSKIAYHGFTGGLMASYTRSVADGQRFGYQTDPQTGMETDIPKQQEVISILGALDVSIPMYADCQAEMDYLCWFVDMPRSRCYATYPWLDGKIANISDMRDDDLLARLFRAAIRGNIYPVMPSDAMEDITTVLRIWLRPSTFWYISELPVRQKLMDMFPNGALVHYAGGTYAASFNENLDDHWVVEFATEGRGGARPGIGESFIDVQDQINVLSNLFHEYLVYGIPPIFHHAKALDKEAIEQMTAKVAQFLPVNMQDQIQSISDLFWNPNPAQVPESLISRLDALAGPVGQFLVGIFPALIGSDVSGAANETAKGYQLQLQQSMGRVAFFYRRLRSFYQRTMYNAVREFSRTRNQDTTLSSQNPNKKPQAISPIAIRKGNFNVYPEADEGYPQLFSDKKDVFTQMFQMADKVPALADDLSEPANQMQIKQAFGLNDWVSAGEDSRLKQLKEIDDLLNAPPQIVAGPNGEPMPQSPLPIMPLDRDEIEFETCQWWASTDSGIDASVNNPAGYENVMLHADLHKQRMAANAPPPEVKYTMTIPLDKMPPEAIVQELEKVGIHLSPQDFAIQHAMQKDLKATAPPKPDVKSQKTKTVSK